MYLLFGIKGEGLGTKLNFKCEHILSQGKPCRAKFKDEIGLKSHYLFEHNKLNPLCSSRLEDRINAENEALRTYVRSQAYPFYRMLAYEELKARKEIKYSSISKVFDNLKKKYELEYDWIWSPVSYNQKIPISTPEERKEFIRLLLKVLMNPS